MAPIPPLVRLLAWRSSLDYIITEARKRKPHGTPTPTVGDVTNRYFTPEDKKETDRLAKEYARLRGQFAKALSAHVGGMESGVLNAADFVGTTRAYIRKYYKAAFELGKRVTADDPTLSDEDIKQIDGEADDEIPYAEKFADDLEAGDGVMDYEQRAGLYTKALDSLFSMGQVSGLPPGTAIHYRLSPAEHCEDCLEFAANSPYTPETLPAVPRDGTSRCNCITTPHSRVLTRRGNIPISDVKVGDYVWTHMNRWRRVNATTLTISDGSHRQARVTTPNGNIIGCTDDHRWLTLDGWATARTAATAKASIVEARMPKVRTQDAIGEIALQTLSAGLPLRREEGLPRRRMPAMRNATEGACPVGSARHARGDSVRHSEGGSGPSSTMGGLDTRVVQDSETRRRPMVHVLLGRDREEAVRLPLPVDLGDAGRADSRRHVCASQEWHPHGRPSRESGVDDSKRAHQGTFHARQDKGNVGMPRSNLPRRARARLSNLQHGFSPPRPGSESASQVLLGRMLSPGTALWDISVEEDHSFVIEGLVSHNSNCKCYLDIDYPESVDAPSTQKPTPKPTPPPELINIPQTGPLDIPDADLEPDEPDLPAYPHPDDAPAASVPSHDIYGDETTDDVAARINDLRAKINYYRQRAELATDPDERADWFRLRKQANADLIDYEAETGVFSTPTWSVKELVQAVKSAPPESLITKPAEIRKGQPVAIMKGRSVWRAKVQDVDGSTVKAKTFEGDEVEFNLDDPPYLIWDAPAFDWDGDGEVEDFEDLDEPKPL